MSPTDRSDSNLLLTMRAACALCKLSISLQGWRDSRVKDAAHRCHDVKTRRWRTNLPPTPPSLRMTPLWGTSVCSPTPPSGGSSESDMQATKRSSIKRGTLCEQWPMDEQTNLPHMRT